jgi:hypothetical protein
MSSRTPVGTARTRFRSIPGFSDQQELPRIAKLRLGIVDKSGTKEHPRETDHFVLDVADSVGPAEGEKIATLFHDLYGQRPQVLTNVRLISPDRELAFSSAYEWWRAGKLGCHGNGEQALRKIDGEWKDWTATNPCANGGCPDFGAKKCGLISRLRFMLPDVTVAGFFQIDTGSVYSAANIRNGLNLIEALTTQMFGASQIHRIPLILARAPQKIEFDGKLNEHFILHLTPQNFTMDGLRQIAEGEASRGPKQIVAGTPVIEDEEEDMPEDHVPASEQLEPEPVDGELAEKIETGISMLSLNAGTVASLRARFPKQQALHEELQRMYRERQTKKAVNA